MDRIKIATVSPSGTFEMNLFEQAHRIAHDLGFLVVQATTKRIGTPAFLNGTTSERLSELSSAQDLDVDALWCVRGGCGAISLWHDYHHEIYREQGAPLVGYSDVSILHFMRFLRAARIGIHGPVFLDLLKGSSQHAAALGLLINKQAHRFSYPTMSNLNHSPQKAISGEFIPMNLTSLASIMGCFDPLFMRGKILAIEDINEPHYKVFRMMHQLKNAGVLTGLRAMVLGYFSHDREDIIRETILPIANEFGIPLFDWPIFGHDNPNWPLLYGARVTLSQVDQQLFTLVYNEQHDHSPIIYGE